ncbi:hypothetical protein AMS68_002114 [Peltaster fructicola]|uniref:FAD-binding domain-containing protein n=1 Tax=Peltaster fructicola TaxID=286661 RepID=A0A6H0XPA8_9PEZI|nr:hypothetical protein AMS68_002114 [Peltaster fructicola]
MTSQSILIVGCGIAGPVLASFLLLKDIPAQQLPRITIVERADCLRAQGQNIDIRGAGVTLMRKLGLETAIRSNTTGEEGARWVDSKDRIWGQFAADKTGSVQTGTSDIEILRGKLGQIFYDRSKTLSLEVKQKGGHGIEYIFGDYLESIDQQGQEVLVRFAKSGEERRYDLVVGADGLQSRTRRMVFGEAGEKERVHNLGLYGGFYSMPKGGNDSEWRRWFHAPGGKGIMVRPSHDPKITTVFMGYMTEDKRYEEAGARELGGVDKQRR